MVRGVLDASVLIGPPVDPATLPDAGAISVMTLAELEIGVLVADATTREERLRVLLDAQRELEPLPVDESVARNYAALVAAARRLGRRPGVIDTIVAATARRHSVPVMTRDRDFLAFDGEVEVVILD